MVKIYCSESPTLSVLFQHLWYSRYLIAVKLNYIQSYFKDTCEKSDWENQKGPDKERNNKKQTKARISRNIDGKENVEMVWTRSTDGFGKKTKIGTGGKVRRRKRKSGETSCVCTEFRSHNSCVPRCWSEDGASKS
jgi:hypothetical protein